MRKHQGRARTRSVFAGLVTAATAVAVTTAAPMAFASDVAFDVTPSIGAPTGNNGTLTVTGTDLFNGVATPFAFFSTASCTANWNTGAPPATQATSVVASNNNSGVITLGTSAAALTRNADGTNKVYNVCIYANGTNGALEGHGTYTVGATYSTTGGPQGGSVVVKGTNVFKDVSPVGAYFSTSACGANYATSGVSVGTVTKDGDSEASVAVPAALALNTTAPLARAYNVCVYNGTTTAATLLLSSTYQVAPSASTVTPNSGVSGGGNTVTASYSSTQTIFSATQTYYGGFSIGGCPAVYTSIPTTQRAAAVTKVSPTSASMVVPAGVGGANGQTFSLCFYSANSGSTLIGTSSANAYSVTMASSTLSSTVGAGSGVTVNLTSTNANAFTASTTPYAVFFPQDGTTQFCPGYYNTTGGTAAQGARKASNSKVSVQFPATALAAGPYSVCVYISNGTAKLAAVATYTVAAVPALSTVSPAQGPALGGNTVTVSGTNLPTTAGAIEVTIGNTPVAPNKVTVGEATFFTFVAPAHSTGSADIVIKTEVGTATLAGAYTYVNSISVTPNSASNTNTAVALDIFGTGFLSYSFSSATASTGAHVYLVRGSYEGLLITGTSAPKERTNVNVAADCGAVWVVEDTELLCVMDLTTSMLATGAASSSTGTRTVTLSGSAASATVTSSTSIFTLSDVGEPVSGSGIDTDSYISKVVDGRTIVLNKVPSGAVSTGITIGFADAARGVNAASSGATTLTAASGTPFNSSYVGKLISETGGGTDIPASTYITGVNSAGTTITLSQPLGGTVASSVEISSSNAVPPGAYNVQIVSDATPGNPSTNTVLSSGSTFTVAPF
ncbi:beta strand repeat-containing protein [Actinoplanes sp. NPDC000266]